MKDESPFKISDFNLIRMIGRGSFGKVLLVESKELGLNYALKVIKKQEICFQRDYENLESEKAILKLVSLGDCPFVIRMHFFFQDKYRVYMGLDYESGGELHHCLLQSDFTESQIRLYTAEIVEAIEFLHKNNIAYRDLKLDNLLLTKEGHIKLCDFGLSKLNMKIDTVTHTYCGSLDTVAPEIIEGSGYLRSADFWSLGVVVYEMMHKKAPFYGPTIQALAQAIANTNLEITADVTQEAKDFVLQLLAKEPKKRLGYGPNAFSDIKSHPWFETLNWCDVASLAIAPELTPPTEGEEGDKNDDKSPLLTPTASVIDLTAQIKQHDASVNKKANSKNK